MGKEKKHKDKDKNREHKKKRKHKSRSKSRDRSEKKHKHHKESKKRKRDKDKDRDVGNEGYEGDRYDYETPYATGQSAPIPGLGDIDLPTALPPQHQVQDSYEESYHARDSAQIPGLDDMPPENIYEHYGEYYEDGELPAAAPEIKEEVEMEGPLPSGYEDPPMDIHVPQSQSRATGGVPQSQSRATGGNEISLSIEDTNKLRAKLGLKPLDMPSDLKDEKASKKEDVHVPAVNLREERKREELRKKLLQAKEKRKINKMLGKVKTLANDSDDDDALAWVKKSRKMEKEKKIAEKRAKLLDEMDNAFGIGDLLDEEFGVKEAEYTSKDLRGLKVQHDQGAFKEGRTVILTLQDRGVLEEEGDEVLINYNMMDDERAYRNIENKKAKPDYNPYEEEFDEYGMPKPKQMLSKYNEEIDGEKKKMFRLDVGGKYRADHERLMRQMQQDMVQHKQVLTLPAPILASEYYTEEEMTTFKKVKRKVRKVRKKPKIMKADDLMPLRDDGEAPSDLGRRGRRTAAPIDPELQGIIEKTGAIPGLDYVVERAVRAEDNPLEDEDDVDGPEEDLTGVVIDDEGDIALQLALEKARKLKLNTKTPAGDKAVVEHISKLPPQAEMDRDSDSDSEDKLTLSDAQQKSGAIKGNITLNQTSEFCRALGEIPTYGQAGNRAEDEDELMDFERELAEERKRKEMEEDAQNPGWKQVEIDTAPVEIVVEDQVVLEEEPMVAAGVAAALLLATKKGYLVKEKLKSLTSGPRHKDMEAKNYSIEDKRYEDLDEKYRKRDRYAGGIITEFKDKEGYKPEVKLDYVDELGRDMSAKEAFRYLSHRFHGKGSGKMKQEKRKKKIDEEELMKSMSSTDTPLGTASMLEEKLQREKTPYLVLSGGNKALTGANDHIAK